ncbi:MAG TPA: rhomboid family intramembrane serine protease [Planctomicrobium sp.]|nr:rhomboid family intramembrane serine protease [Planctomicrobium sp.]
MRRIGNLSTASAAERFHRYLSHRGIDNRVDAEKEQWDIWVYDETHIADAKEALVEFEQNPKSAKFDAPVVAAPKKEVVPKRREVRELRDPAASNLPITIMTAVLCLWLTLSTGFGSKTELLADLQIATPGSTHLTQVQQGEVWRLVTPIYLHFSVMHIGFNLYIFWMLGGVIERVKGSRSLLFLILSIAIFSNLVQFYASGPGFGGLSGVVYGLFGFLWMRSVLLPSDGFFMPQSIVTQMILWAVICVIARDYIPVANGAHFGGLVAGMALGAAPRLWRR